MKFCVYTRSFYESPYINFFIEHYLKLGFEKIYILKTDEEELKINKNFLNYVKIISVKNKGNYTLVENQSLIKKSNFDWVFTVDIDEFLFLDLKFININDYVCNVLLKNTDINIISFRWLTINKFENKNDTLENIIKKKKLITNINIKSLVKIDKIKKINPHICEMNVEPVIFFENYNKKKIPPLYELTLDSYNDSCIVHVHTRSFNNLFLKSFETVLVNKSIENKGNLVDLINNKKYLTMGDDELINNLKKNIGNKITLCFSQLQKFKTLYNLDKFEKKFKFFNYETVFIDENIQDINLKNLLNKNGINQENYKIFSDRVVNIINKKEYF